jgi:hypothetical protein
MARDARLVPDIADFQRTIVRAGEYNGPPAHSPVLRDAAGVPYQTLLAGPGLPRGTILSISVPAVGGGPTLAATPVVGVGPPVPDPESGGVRVPFTAPGPAGNAVYLPFIENMITYTLLPHDPASTVDYFYTHSLSGCSVFIDRNPATNDLVVYHANRSSLTGGRDPAEYLSTTPLEEQYQAARNQMRVDRQRLRGQLDAALGVALAEVATLERPTYRQCVEDEKERKRAQGRRAVDDLSGTNVMGFRVGGDWQFWWQTWTILSYDRPLTAPKVIASGRHQDFEAGTGRLLATTRFL